MSIATSKPGWFGKNSRLPLRVRVVWNAIIHVALESNRTISY